MSPLTTDYPPLSNWQDLERLSIDLFGEIHGRPFQRWGRDGQNQDGIDGWMQLENGKAIVLQCKGKAQRFGKRLKPDDVDAAVQAVGAFPFPIEALFLLTTAPDDAKVLRRAGELSSQRVARGEWPVQVWGWGTVCHHIGRHERIQQAYFGHWFKRVSIRQWVALATVVAALGSASVVGSIRFLSGQQIADRRQQESVKELQHFVALTNDLRATYAVCEKVLVEKLFTFQAEFRRGCTQPVMSQLKGIDLQIQRVAPLLPAGTWTEIHQLSELMAEDYRQAEMAAFMTQGFENEVVTNMRDLCFKNRDKSQDKGRVDIAREAAKRAMGSQLNYYFTLRDFILPGLGAMNARVLVQARGIAGESVPLDLARQANKLQMLLRERKSFEFKAPNQPFSLSAVKAMSARNTEISSGDFGHDVEDARWGQVYVTAVTQVFHGRPRDIEALIECGVLKPQARELATRL